MATNLKKGKKIRAFCYRIITVGAFLTMIVSGIMGREAFAEIQHTGSNVLSGDIYYLSDFREYIASLYNLAMVGCAGVGDDNGYPLTDSNADTLANQSLHAFSDEMDKTAGDILCHIETDQGLLWYSNISYPVFSEYDGHLLLPDDAGLCCYWNGSENALHFFKGSGLPVAGSSALSFHAQYRPNSRQAERLRLVMAVKKDGAYQSDIMNRFDMQAKAYRNVLILFIISAVLTALFGLCSLCSFKAAREAKASYALFTKKIWLEIKLAVLVGVISLCYAYQLVDFMASPETRILITNDLWLVFPFSMVFYLLWTDLRLNGAAVPTNSVPVKCCRYLAEYAAGVHWYRKAMNMCTVTLLGTLTALGTGGFLLLMCLNGSPYAHILLILGGGLLLVGFLMFLTYLRLRRFVRDIKAVTEKLSELQEGLSGAPLSVSKHSLLKLSAQNINALEDGIENAVEQKNRSNKMRVELITNVSHDLKTPLTSIINYADLLCEEGLPEPAAQYAVSLQEKAYRLKNMVQDVFDLSKATSGNLTVEKHLLDLVKLVRQTLADMDERITESGLTMKLNISTEPIMIEADGDKLYRIFQNLIANALIYSLEHSRVHILLSAEGGYAVAKIKNTSRGELDFDPEEIVERFVRGDASRTSEGSGLGLSIARSFTESCGGIFSIDIDADMFTVTVKFPLAPQPEE